MNSEVRHMKSTNGYNYKTYRKDAFERTSSFERAFKPWNKWQDVKLTDICPCNTCVVNKELHARQYEIQMSSGLQEEISEPCKHCFDDISWKMECIEKLCWYEDNDERLKT